MAKVAPRRLGASPPSEHGVERRAGTASKSRQGRRPAQGNLPFRTWGGRRVGAGRKPAGERAGVPHVARDAHLARHPVHVTLRAARALPSLRKESIFLALRGAIACCSEQRFRVLHFSVQSDHVHLLVEAADPEGLSRGVSGLSIRLARAINRVLGRRGRVWGDRYHARTLRTPREVRHALVHVLMNWRKHVHEAREFDPCASVFWFDGWRTQEDRTRAARAAARQGGSSPAPPVSPPRTWLASKGWRRHGLIDAKERPAARD